jgi:hypothetical protein
VVIEIVFNNNCNSDHRGIDFFNEQRFLTMANNLVADALSIRPHYCKSLGFFVFILSMAFGILAIIIFLRYFTMLASFKTQMAALAILGAMAVLILFLMFNAGSLFC